MPESVVKIVRTCLGFFLVIFGYIASIKERYMGMPLIGLKEQPTGIINGFVATLGGVLLISTSTQKFFLLGLPLIYFYGKCQSGGSNANSFVVMGIGAGFIGSSIASEVVITLVLIAVAIAIRMFMDKRYKEKNEIE